MGTERHIVTDHESQRTFEVVVQNEKTVIALNEKVQSDVTLENGKTFDEGVWLPVPTDSEWWEQWQGEANSGAFETPNEPIE
jgi:hypothetical protein